MKRRGGRVGSIDAGAAAQTPDGPPETVIHTYQEHEGSPDGWDEAWARRVVRK